MKIRIKTRRKEVKSSDERVFDGSWTEARERLVKLKPLDLRAFPNSVMIARQNMRSYLGRTAKMEGIEYFTLGIPGTDTMLVVRSKPLKKGTHDEDGDMQ